MNDRERKHAEDMLGLLRSQRQIVVAAKETKDENNWPADKEIADLAAMDKQIAELEGKLG